VAREMAIVSLERMVAAGSSDKISVVAQAASRSTHIDA
jgi:hypothetical protein